MEHPTQNQLAMGGEAQDLRYYGLGLDNGLYNVSLFFCGNWF